MSRTAAVPESEGLFREPFCHISAQIRIRDKENLVIFQSAADLQGTGTGHADIALGLQLRRRVDIGHDGIAGVLRLQLPQCRHIHLLGHGTSRQRVCQQNLFSRIQDLAGLRHKAHAAHEHALLGHLRGLQTQPVRIPNEIRHLQNRLALVGVCQNTVVLLLFQPQDLLLHLLYCHRCLLFFYRLQKRHSAVYQRSEAACSHGCRGTRNPACSSAWPI